MSYERMSVADLRESARVTTQRAHVASDLTYRGANDQRAAASRYAAAQWDHLASIATELAERARRDGAPYDRDAKAASREVARLIDTPTGA